MKATTFWQRELAVLADSIDGDIPLMEVCGSHSMAIAESGLRALLPAKVRLLSGPGCPVCVSTGGFIADAMELSRRNVKLALFGDLLRIPGPDGTLAGCPGVMVIYSPEEALEYAVAHPTDEVVFAAVGFESTNAAMAAVLEEAEERKLDNFSLLCDLKHLRPVLDDLATDPATRLRGFILPGHVASVVGEAGFTNLRLPGVIAGFTPENILHSIARLLELIRDRQVAVVNNYRQVVAPRGNEHALALIDRYFECADGEWRGMGMVPGGVRKLRSAYTRFDAAKRYALPSRPMYSAAGCRCAEILRGHLAPAECPIFAKKCTPSHPVGACMASSEGACAAIYLYGMTR